MARTPARENWPEHPSQSVWSDFIGHCDQAVQKQYAFVDVQMRGCVDVQMIIKFLVN
jgi:hypothetical protein